MNSRSLIIASAVSGLAVALLSNLPLVWFGNCALCMWLWAGGVLAVWFYRRLEGAPTSLTAGRGALIGALTGIIGAILGTILITTWSGALIAKSLPPRAGLFQSVLNKILDFVVLRQTFSWVQALTYAVVYPVFGSIGGAIAASIFGKSSDQA
ncbi:MAG: hypothetical protein PVF70_07390 [Anaerolineales bacterium]|jgi:hypothetical protein